MYLYVTTVLYSSLIPRPCPAFRRLQYGRAGRAWYLFSREHDVISKWRKFAKLTGCVSCIFNRLHAQRSMCKAQCVRQSAPASCVCGVSYLVSSLFSLFWAQCTHAQLNPFYHPFYPDITHVRKDTRPSPALLYCKRWKARKGLGARLLCSS